MIIFFKFGQYDHPNTYSLHKKIVFKENVFTDLKNKNLSTMCLWTNIHATRKVWPLLCFCLGFDKLIDFSEQQSITDAAFAAKCQFKKTRWHFNLKSQWEHQVLQVDVQIQFLFWSRRNLLLTIILLFINSFTDENVKCFIINNQWKKHYQTLIKKKT